MVGVLPHELAERAPTLLTGLERELSTPHRAIIEVRPPDLSLVRSILPLNPRPGAPTGRATVGVRVDPPYVGGVDATPADFVSVAHSLWQPGILPSPDPVPATGAPGVLAIDPWAGLMGNEGPRVGSVNPGPHGPVPISRLRQEAIRLIGLVDLVRLEGRPLPEIAVRYALDSPGVSATLLTLPSPEFWTAALRAAENGPLTRREQEWIHRYGPRPGLDPGVASDRPQR